ncbi:MAG: pilus assembly protein PilM [Candidatus Nomurabacteria bacterium]|nr:pilus assembly protein PilM [Candidatus Nomurabacteria bacterium]
MGIIDNFTKSFSKVFSSKKGRGNVSLGIDIGSSSIKIVQLKRDRGVIVLETYGEIALGQYANASQWEVTHLPPTTIATVVRDLAEQSKTTATSGNYGIAASTSLVAVVKLPGTLSERDIAQAIPNEARKYIPVPLEEVSLDWWAIPSRVERKTVFAEEVPLGAKSSSEKLEPHNVLIAAVHHDTIKNYSLIASEAKIPVESIEIEMFSSIRSLLRNDLHTVAVVDFGASSTRIGIIDTGVLRALSNIPRGQSILTRNLATTFNIDFDKAEKLKRSVGLSGSSDEYPQAKDNIKSSFQYVVDQLQSSLIEFEKSNNQSVRTIICVGGGAQLKGLTERLTEVLQTEVIIGKPFQRTKVPEFLSPILDRVGSSFSVAVGLALRSLQ